MAGERKAYLGHRVRKLRRELGLGQAELARGLGISASYLNLIEHNQRPLTVALLLKLAQDYGADLQSLAEDEDQHLLHRLREVFGEPVFSDHPVRVSALEELATLHPDVARGVLALHRAWATARADLDALAERVADRDQLAVLQTRAFPVEEVRDFFQARANHFPELEHAAETLWTGAGLQAGELGPGLTAHLQAVHGLKAKVLPAEVMGVHVRRLDRHQRRLLLSELLPPAARVFHIAHQIGQLAHRPLMDELIAKAAFHDPEARRLARLGLANYFAGAVLMPYDRFLQAAEALLYDVERLEARFDVSFEQVCHRLTTLQRPNARGVPFFLIRVDKAGNVSKRFAAGSSPFARFGGACPLWVVYDAFRTPGLIQTQQAQLPDGTTYVTLARTVTRSSGGHRLPAQVFALGLGCEAAHAGKLIYARHLNLTQEDSAAPIGVNCRLCERANCPQRAVPPLHHRMIADDAARGFSPYAFQALDEGAPVPSSSVARGD